MNIRINLKYPIKDGTEVVFRSPVDCSQITGLKVYYQEDGNTDSMEFAFVDAHGNNVGDIDHLFAENVVVKVILDVTNGMAFVQNADTNAYIERTFIKTVNGKAPDDKGNVEVAELVEVPEGGGASSWNDLKDKPFGDDVVLYAYDKDGVYTEDFELPYIGDVTARYTKISDETPNKEFFIGKKLNIERTDGGPSFSEIIDESLITDISVEQLNVAEVIDVLYEEVSDLSGEIKFSTGVWICIPQTMPIDSIQIIGTKTIDEKYIPNTIARTSDIQPAVNDALEQAKESGEFKGEKGASIYYTDVVIQGTEWELQSSQIYPNGNTIKANDFVISANSDLNQVANVSENGVVKLLYTGISFKGETGSQGIKGDKGDKGDTGAAGKDGANGKDGQDGKDGADGKTPVKGTDYFTEADKAEMVEAVKTSMDGIPDYWQTALDNGVKSINTALCKAGRNKSAFLFYSDAHWNNNRQMSPILLKYLHNNTGMTKTFFGGDIVNNEATDYDTMKYLWEWRKQLKDLPNHHSVVGNHDDGNATNNLFSEQYVYGYLLAAEETPDIVRGDGIYYYIDNPSEKTRYLFLDTAYKGVDSAQTAFITDALKSTPDGWHIVVVAHMWYGPDYDQYDVKPIPIKGLYDSASAVVAILDSYNNRNGEFVDCGARVEFCIGGHTHIDYDGRTLGGIPILLVETDSSIVRSAFAHNIGTTSEASVNGIIADYDANTIKVVRIGRGSSREVDIRQIDVNYTNLIKTSIDADKNPYNGGIGWKSGYRLSSSGAETAQSGLSVTGFMEVALGDVIRFKNIASTDTTTNTRIVFYDANFAKIEPFIQGQDVIDVFNSGGYVVYDQYAECKYFRVSATDITDNSIITTNQLIPDDGAKYTNVIPFAIDSTGAIFNGGKGWADNSRIGSGKLESYIGSSTFFTTGHIEIDPTIDNTIRLRNITFNSTSTDTKLGIAFYNASFARVNPLSSSSNNFTNPTAITLSNGYDPVLDGTNILQFTIHNGYHIDNTAVKYIAICAEYIGDDSIITINEEIE